MWLKDAKECTVGCYLCCDSSTLIIYTLYSMMLSETRVHFLSRYISKIRNPVQHSGQQHGTQVTDISDEHVANIFRVREWRWVTVLWDGLTLKVAALLFTKMSVPLISQHNIMTQKAWIFSYSIFIFFFSVELSIPVCKTPIFTYKYHTWGFTVWMMQVMKGS